MNELQKYIDTTNFSKILLDEVEDIIVIKDINYKYIYCNNAFAELMGMSKEQIIGKSDFDLFLFEEANSIRIIDKDVLEKKEDINFDYQLKAPTGNLWINVSLSAISINDTLIGIKFVGKNIEDLIKANSNEILIDSENNLLSSILNNIDISIFSLDRDYKYTSFNRKYYTSMKTRRNHTIELGRSIFEYLDTEFERSKVKQLLNKAFAGEKTLDFVNDEKNKYFYETSFLPISLNNEIVGVTVTISDISERIKTNEKILLLTKAIEQSTNSVVITDLKGVIEYANDSFLNFIEYTANETIGKELKEFSKGLISEEKGTEMWLSVIKGDIWKGESQIRNKSGEIFWINTSISPINDSYAQVNKILVIMQNITEQKEMLEEQDKLIEELMVVRDTIEESIANQNSLIYELSQTQEKLEKSNNEKDRFFSIIAHDLKNPFVTLLNNSEMLELYFSKMDDTAKLKMIREIKQASKHTYSLLENLLQWSRSQMGNIQYSPDNIDINTLLTKVGLLLKSQSGIKNIAINIDCPADVVAYCDRDMIDTVIRNLVSNAIKFSNPDSTINLIVCEYDQEYYLISVQDTGIGMNQEIMDKLFKLSENVSRKGTNNEKGTGLGLLLCKDFIEMNDGRIWVESTEGIGSTFNFTIPKGPGNIE